MLVIRLSPVGKKHQKFFRIIVSEKTKDVFGDYLELLGRYNPHPDKPEVDLKTDRIKHWLSKGAQLSPTVHNLFVDQKIIEDKKVTSWKPKKKKVDEEAPKEEPKVKETKDKPAETKE
ncbi:30S ribosomal protein S16 [Patescibacteria group bacterium]|nr:30S ribosomal protein S16 [Patescibacteria group bacterium]MBU1890141.1 30S ribosomal protein S16 [Patescibacteria group bacterium]